MKKLQKNRFRALEEKSRTNKLILGKILPEKKREIKVKLHNRCKVKSWSVEENGCETQESV